MKQVIITGVLMDDHTNRNGRRYATEALVKAALTAKGIKLYSNVALGADQLEENLLGEVISATVSHAEGRTTLSLDCAVDCRQPGWQMVFEPFVMIPDGVGTIDIEGVVTEFSLSCVGLAPKELGAFSCASMSVKSPNAGTIHGLDAEAELSEILKRELLVLPE